MRWGLLVRISDDRAGEGLGIARQEKDIRALIGTRGGHVEEVYRENDTSAFKRRVIVLPNGRRERRVLRPEFRRALDDLHTGRIDGLAVYDLDRLTRDPRDLEDLIDVVKETGRPAISVTGSLDLSTSHGVAMSRVQVAIASKASEDTSRRVTRKHVELAEAGRVAGGGNRPYGYTADRVAIVEEEAAVVRELARRRLAGEGWQTLARDLNARGVPCVSAAHWTISSVRAALLKPHVAGIRFHRGQEITRGTWSPILDRGTWEQLRGMTGEYRPPPVRRYLLSGLARCALCGHGLGASKDRGRAIYRCKHISCGRVSRDMVDLDAYLIGVVLGLLADVDLTPRPVDDPAEKELADLLGRRAAVVAAFADVAGDPPSELRRVLADLDRKIGTVRRRLRPRGTVLADVRGLSRRAWDALPLDRRRAVIAALVTVVVGRSLHGKLFDTDSVQVEPV